MEIAYIYLTRSYIMDGRKKRNEQVHLRKTTTTTTTEKNGAWVDKK